MAVKNVVSEIELSDKDFDRYVKLAEIHGITPGEYLKRALEAYAKYHHPRVEGKLHPCVNAVACPDCGSEIGEPCKNVDERTLDKVVKHSLETHYMRRNAYKRLKCGDRLSKRKVLEEQRRVKSFTRRRFKP